VFCDDAGKEGARARVDPGASSHYVKRAMSGFSKVGVWLSIAALGACRGVLGIEQDPPPVQPAATNEPSDPAVSDESEPRFCSSAEPKPDFCADFDDGEIGNGFYNASKRPDPGEHGGGTIRPDDVIFASSPRSVRFALPPLLGTSSMASAFLLQELKEPPQSTTIKLDLRIDTESIPEGKGRFTLVNLNFGKDVGAIGVFRDAKGTSLEVYDKDTVKVVPFTTPIPIGQWRTLTLLIHNYKLSDKADAPQEGEVIAVLGGPVAKLPLPTTFRRSEMLPRLEIGAFVARGPMEEMRLNIDNVRILYGLPPP
jgi:hypothetical protein